MAAGSFSLNKTDLKSTVIAVAIAAAGGLYWMYRNKSAGNGGSSGSGSAAANNSSAANGMAGAISPSSTINTYDVFPTVSSQSATANGFFNGAHGNVSPTQLQSNATTWLSKGQGMPLPVKS